MTRNQPQSETPDRGWCGDRRRGASMGRRSENPATWGPEECELVPVYIDAAGYDPGGSYWGQAEPLYELVGEENSHFFRFSGDIDAAREYVASEWPELTLAQPAKLDRSQPCRYDIDVTAVVNHDRLTIGEPEAQAVRLWLLSLGGSWTEAEVAAMGPEALASVLSDWVDGCEQDDVSLYKGDDCRTYFYAGE